MDRAGWDIVYPPIYEDFNRWGDRVYRVVLSNQTENIELGHPLPREEADRRVREMLRHGLREGRYLARDFYPHDDNDMQLPRRVVNTHRSEDSYGQHCSGGVPASGEAIMGLPETTVKEGECSVCLENFEGANNKLRMMPCSHSFHEQCIFNWLRINHVCPLCRFPLPTEQQK